MGLGTGGRAGFLISLSFPLIPSRLRSWRGLEPFPDLRGVRWRKTMIGQCRLSWKGACVSGGDVWGIGDFWMAHETVRQTNGVRHQNLGGIDNRREAVQRYLGGHRRHHGRHVPAKRLVRRLADENMPMRAIALVRKRRMRNNPNFLLSSRVSDPRLV